MSDISDLSYWAVYLNLLGTFKYSLDFVFNSQSGVL